jgi:hypothetical protein
MATKRAHVAPIEVFLYFASGPRKPTTRAHRACPAATNSMEGGGLGASRGRFSYGSDVSHCRISVLSLLGPCGSSILATGHWVHSFVRRGHHLGCRM